MRFSKELRILDLGTGTGRLVPQYITLSRFFAAIDRDRTRIDFGRILAVARRAGKCIDIHVINANSLAEICREPFDFIIISHVLQHIPRFLVHQILEQCVEKLTRDGMIYVAIPVTHEPDEYYVIMRKEADQVVSRIVDEAEFTHVCKHPSQGDLPGRVFSMSAIVELCQQHRLYMMDGIAYHYYKDYRGDHGQLLHLRGAIPPSICDIALLLEKESR
jgi:SAM-dependent methyltransferase